MSFANPDWDVIPSGFVYNFPAIIDAWHDGDTCYVHRGICPGVQMHGEHVRVQGINAPELSASGGYGSLNHAAELAPTGTLVTLTCSKQDKYGRLLAKITLPDGSDFGDHMIADGQAAPYLT